jgi:hypothetical protein
MPGMIAPSTFQQAFGDKTSHAHVPGIGYVRMGQPPMPRHPLGDAKDCEPEHGTESLTMHTLLAPHGEEIRNFRWYAETKEWAPLVPHAGNRLAFTSRYLAAHGWRYGHSQ